jgi:hypothetical protein
VSDQPEPEPTSPQQAEPPGRYPLPLYLNQKYVFDVLSMMEGGFTQLETVTERDAGTAERSHEMKGGVGFSNVFGLLNVSLGGGRAQKTGSEQSREVAAERVHTPNSLFARMRERLYEEGLVATSLDANAPPGSFVELALRLEKNPLLEGLETLESLMKLAVIFDDSQTQQGQSGGRRSRSQGGGGSRKTENEKMLEQMSEMMGQLKTGETLDLLASTPAEPDAPRVVLTLDTAYASDPSLSDLIDGEYRVLGKVTRAIPEDGDETINLLRKTSLGRLQGSSLDELTKVFQDDDSPFDLPQMETQVAGPAVQILPIAIFA